MRVHSKRLVDIKLSCKRKKKEFNSNTSLYNCLNRAEMCCTFRPTVNGNVNIIILHFFFQFRKETVKRLWLSCYSSFSHHLKLIIHYCILLLVFNRRGAKQKGETLRGQPASAHHLVVVYFFSFQLLALVCGSHHKSPNNELSFNSWKNIEWTIRQKRRKLRKEPPSIKRRALVTIVVHHLKTKGHSKSC